MADFFRLYINENVFESHSFGIIMLILYANATLYLLDFYKLVKRKSQAETLAMMCIPLVVSVMGATMAALFLSVPAPGHLDVFIVAFTSKGLCLELMGIVILYMILWFITYVSQKKRNREDVRKWMLSCSPDYCFGIIILVGTVCRLFFGIAFFEAFHQRLLWIYLYSIFFLSCKVILLFVGNLVRLYSGKIKIFPWTEKKNPENYLARYFYFYQNAIGRNTILFELGLLIPLTMVVMKEGWTSEMVSMMAFLYLGAVFVVAYSTASVRRGLNQFAKWGVPATTKRMFCQEYFTEDALYKDDNFTITRHFLIAEQSPADIYYWSCLTYISGWIIKKEGKYRELHFEDGKVCRLDIEEAMVSEKVFEFARKNLELNIMEKIVEE